MLSAWDLQMAASACELLFTEQADLYRPDPVTGHFPGTPTHTGVACAVEPINRLALLTQGGGGPEAPVRWELRFADGTDIQARDQVRVTTLGATYQVAVVNDPSTNSLYTACHAEQLE